MNVKTAQPSDSFFSALARCVFVSAVLLASATALKLPPWTAMVGGGLPLVWYHLGYLSPRAKKGLSQTAIDSVYYFGFLVTIAALAASAVTLASSGGHEPMSNIAFQFGLGLLATGYAVLARMHLASVTSWVDEASPEAVLDRYVQRSRELVTNVELASTQFVELSNNLMAKSQLVADTARLATEKSMLDVARLFDEQLRGTLASARQGLTEIRGLVNETSFVREREELVRSVKVTLECVTQLNTALGEFAQRSTEGARTSQSVAAATAALNTTLGTFRENLEVIGGEDGQMTKSASTLTAAQTVVAESTSTLSHAVKELGEVSGAVAGMGKTFRSVKTLTQKTGEQLEALANSALRLDTATTHIENSANATEALAMGLERATRALPLLAEQSGSLEKQLSSLGLVVSAVEQQMQTMPRPTEEAIALSIELKRALASVHEIISSASIDAKVLAGHSAENVQSLQQAHKLARDVTALQSTSESVNMLLAKFALTVESVQSTLSSSTGTLRTAISTATQSLESDVQRTSNAASLFGQRLTDVAQIIIDRTREGRRHEA